MPAPPQPEPIDAASIDRLPAGAGSVLRWTTAMPLLGVAALCGVAMAARYARPAPTL